VKAKFLNNLQLKVTVVFLLVSLVPLGTVSVFSVRTANNVIESIVQNQLENVAAEKQALLERWIMERKADMEVLAGSSAVKEMDPAEVAPYFELVGDQYGTCESAAVKRPGNLELQVIEELGFHKTTFRFPTTIVSACRLYRDARNL